MAEIFDELENRRRANALRKKAAALFKKFNEVFWDEKSGFYAYALDGDKKKVLSVASNVGQCLWSGIVAPKRAAAVVKRLMQKDMWSGWGIRTLSADHPSFNPYNYQTGAVWPHDNSLIAMGMRRYGFAAEAAAIARDISGAASHFLLMNFRNCMAACNAIRLAFRCSTLEPTCRKLRRLGHHLVSSGNARNPSRTHRVASRSLIQRCPNGCLI